MFRQSAVVTDHALREGTVDLKRAALLFDKVTIIRTAAHVSDHICRLPRIEDAMADELDWLQTNGIIEIEDDPLGGDYAANHPIFSNYQVRELNSCNPFLLDTPEAVQWGRSAGNIRARAASIIYQEQRGSEYVPLLQKHTWPRNTATVMSQDQPKLTAMNVVLSQMPVPDELTPWDDILAFRQDGEAETAFLGIRIWLNKLAKTGSTESEILDQLLWEKHKYEKALKLHKLKWRHQTFETVITATLEFVERAATLRWSQAAKSLFGISKAQLDLMEAEQKQKDNELRYFVMTNERFAQRRA